MLYSKYTNDDSVSFVNLKPAVYIARIKVDENENGIWDEADFANNILAEPIYIYEKTIEVRPLWRYRRRLGNKIKDEKIVFWILGFS